MVERWVVRGMVAFALLILLGAGGAVIAGWAVGGNWFGLFRPSGGWLHKHPPPISPCTPIGRGGGPFDWRQWNTAARWSPDGSEVYLAHVGLNPGIYAVAADGSRLTLIAETSPMPQGPGGPLAAFDVSPDGSRIAYSSCRYRSFTRSDGGLPTYFNYRPEIEILVLHPDGSRGVRRLTTNSDFDNYPSWSPDGTRIAFLTGNVGFPTWEPGRQRGLHTLHTRVADGSGTMPVFLPIHDGASGDSLDFAHQPARWSPDGQRLAFVTKTDVGADDALNTFREIAISTIYTIYTIGADGADRQRLTEAVSGPSWSPDGTRLAYAKVDGDEVALYTSRVDGSDVRRVTTIEGWHRVWYQVHHEHPAGAWIETVAWSPDGSRILYTCGWSVCVVNVDGSAVGRSPDGLAARVAGAGWSPDGSEIAVHRGDTEFPNVGSRISDADVALYTMAPDGTDIEVLAWHDAALGLKTVGAGGQGEAADVAACGAGTAVLEPTGESRPRA